jgi:hypothetical protein
MLPFLQLPTPSIADRIRREEMPPSPRKRLPPSIFSYACSFPVQKQTKAVLDNIAIVTLKLPESRMNNL